MELKKPTKPMTKCRYADRYKATKPPTCGCDLCAIKWRLEQLRRDIVKEGIHLTRHKVLEHDDSHK